MRAWAIPVLASILILGTLGLSQDVFAQINQEEGTTRPHNLEGNTFNSITSTTGPCTARGENIVTGGRIHVTCNAGATTACTVNYTYFDQFERRKNGTLTVNCVDEDCLIATATYGSELATEVQMLREIRDIKLRNTESGTSFMDAFNSFYYIFSPTIAQWENESPAFKEVVKIAITPLITSLSILNYVDMDSEVEVLGYGISLILLNIGMYVGIPASVIVVIRRF